MLTTVRIAAAQTLVDSRLRPGRSVQRWRLLMRATATDGVAWSLGLSVCVLTTTTVNRKCLQ